MRGSLNTIIGCNLHILLSTFNAIYLWNVTKFLSIINIIFAILLIIVLVTSINDINKEKTPETRRSWHD
jgi:hypothetical protein